MERQRARQRIAILINPASGKKQPVLWQLNRALSERDVRWECFITQPGCEDTVRAALKWKPDAVMVYGGDGTVSEVASVFANLDCDVPLAVLPGGTANALADGLGVPSDLSRAVIANLTGTVKDAHLGVSEQGSFLLRASIGAAAECTSHATREEKESYGIFAYVLSIIRALEGATPRGYEFEVDGTKHQHDAVGCVIANSDGVGMLGTSLGKQIDASDGMLDLIIIPGIGRPLLNLIASAPGAAELADGLPHFRGSSIRVACDEQDQILHLDGEPEGSLPFACEVRRSCLRLLRPRRE